MSTNDGHKLSDHARAHQLNPTHIPKAYRTTEEREHNLNRSEWVVLDFLWSSAGAYGTCQVTNAHIAKACNVKERQVQNIIALLENRGYGFRDDSNCDQWGRQAPTWYFYDSDAYYDYLVQLHQQDERERRSPYCPHQDDAIQQDRQTRERQQAHWEALNRAVDGMDMNGLEACEEW